jgi:galactokinase
VVPHTFASVVPHTFAVFAPGRINLIGEHTDYSGGLVLPVAVDRGVTVRWRPDAAIHLRSAELPESVELGADGTAPPGLAGWVRYAAAVAELLRERGRPAGGLDGTVTSTLPMGAGLSSSAALTVALALAFCRAAGFELPRLELAHVAQEAERRAVGVPVGLMDPAASLLARRGHALLLDCGTEQHRLVPLPARLAVVVFDSGIRRSLEHSGYTARRAELERALASLGGQRPSELGLDEALAAAREASVDETAVRRLRHVVSENLRVREMVATLESPGDVDLQRIGELMRAGHRSLRDDFEVSTPELDLLVELAYDGGAIGARLTGGGFGGSVVAIADEGDARSLVGSISGAYRSRTGLPGTGYVCATADAASEVFP